MQLKGSAHALRIHYRAQVGTRLLQQTMRNRRSANPSETHTFYNIVWTQQPGDLSPDPLFTAEGGQKTGLPSKPDVL